MTMFEGEFVCDNCAQTFPLNLATIVRTTDLTPAASEPERTFCSPDCSLEYERRGGSPRSEQRMPVSSKDS